MYEPKTGKINAAPHSPGVYIFRRGKEILYVGKARDLKKRLKYYLSIKADPRIRAIVKRSDDLEYIVTGSEEEALLLEANLIKIHKPKYNIRLKDDKKYPYIKITGGPYPAIALTRNLKESGITIFGPYVNAQAVRKTIRALRKIFPIRVCKYKLPTSRKITPCIDYHIGKCLAPCIPGKVDAEIYGQIIQNVTKFLKGDTDEIEAELEEKMKQASRNLEYEKAKIFRDELLAIRKLSKEQAVQRLGGENKDICVVYRIYRNAIAYIIKVREGTVVDRESYFLETSENDKDEEILSGFLVQYYSTSAVPPQLVVIDKKIKDLKVVSSALKLDIRVTESTEDRRLIEMAYENARNELEEEVSKKKGVRDIHPGLIELSELLNLPQVPERVEACDISQLFGSEKVGSFVCFLKKSLSKSNYRRYKIQTYREDDPHMIYEIVKRRLDDEPLPDVIIIDGGLPQLSLAKKAKKELGKDIPLIAFAKRFDDIYLEDGRRVMIPKRSHLFSLMKVLRDEAHRFAITYHRKLRSKKIHETSLKIDGVGPKTTSKLIQHFGSMKKIREASLEEIKGVQGIGEKMALKIYRGLREYIQRNNS